MMSGRTDRPKILDRYHLFLVLRFAVFLLIAATIPTSRSSGGLRVLYAALAYFALSELLLLVRSPRTLRQGLALGVYFLDVYAVSLLIPLQDGTALWYLTIPLLILGVAFSYDRRGAWIPIALIPSLLLFYRAGRPWEVLPERAGEFGAVAFVLTVLAWGIRSLAARADEIFGLYLGQRRLVQGIPEVSPPPSLRECLPLILDRETPVEVDWFAILRVDGEGDLDGLERVGDGAPERVRLTGERIPPLLQKIKGEPFSLVRTDRQGKGAEFFRVRRVGSLAGRWVRIGDTGAYILFGRRGPKGFLAGESHLLSTHAEILAGWMRQSHAWETARAADAISEPSGPGENKDPAGEASGQAPTGRLREIEEENRRLREALDSQTRVYTEDVQKTVESLMEKENELDRKVFERLAAVELSRAVAKLFDLDLILDLILEVICRRLSVESASIMLLREREGDLVVHASRGLKSEVAQKTRLMLGEAIAGYVAEKGEPLLIEDIEKDPRFVPFRRDRYRSGTLLSVPILHQDRVLGVINLSDPIREGPFVPRDLEVLQALSRQAAIAIVNHRLYQEFENGEWIRELYEAGLSEKLSKRVLQESLVLEEVEGEVRVSVVAVRLHEHRPGPAGIGVEERIERIRAQFRRIREILVGHQGDVAGDVGTGMIGIFGLPFPDSGDARQAMLAAVELLKSFATPEAEASGKGSPGFGISVGVASGALLLRGISGPTPYVPFGETWDRVMILMEAGSPGQILVDQETFDAVRDWVHGVPIALPYGIRKQMTVYGIKGLHQEVAVASGAAEEEERRW